MYRYQSRLEPYEATLCDRCGAECTDESIQINVSRNFLEPAVGDFCRTCSLALTGLSPKLTALPRPDPAGASADPDHTARHLIDLMRDIDETAEMLHGVCRNIHLEWSRSFDK